MNALDFIADNPEICLQHTYEHMVIVGIALIISMVIGVPTGILISRHEPLAKRVINLANTLMTIPSIALFGLMLSLLAPFGYSMGRVPAIIALVLYSQLPIIRNTYTAIKNVPPSFIDAGRGMGMSQFRLLREIEIPMAVPVIVAGLRTAAVMSIGIAAIATYIGAEGLGVLIQRGIDQDFDAKVIAGALLIAALAIIVDTGTAGFEKLITPKGLKIERKTGAQ